MIFRPAGVRGRRAAPALIALLVVASPAAQTPPGRAALQEDLAAVLSAPILARSHWSVLIKSLDRGDVVYARNPGKLVLPASNMKVFTMAGAAERLGWDYRFETTLESNASIVDGTLQGDLIVRGSGDPSIALRDGVAAKAFDEWAQQLKSAGITAIAGGIVGDDSAFDRAELGRNWEWDDLAYGYAAPVNALTYNESLIRITATPGAKPGDPAVIAVAPPAGHGLTIVNRVLTAAAGEPEAFDFRRERGSPVLEVVGSVPIGSKEPAGLSASVDDPARFFVRSLRAALIARGIRVQGGNFVAATNFSQKRTVLARHRSAPLSELARTFLKVSQNLYGELLVKTIGRAAGEGTWARGQQAIAETFDAWGVPRDAYMLADGSGLSRMNLVSAEAVVKVLEHVYADPRHRTNFMEALPVGGKDGTLRNRLKAAWTVGTVQAKTGSISSGRALSGYVKTRGGETLVFSIVANNFSLPAWRIERVIDLIVEIIAR